MFEVWVLVKAIVLNDVEGLQYGGLKNNRAVGGGRKPGDRPQGERPQTGGDGQLRTVKFASGEPQGDRTNNRRPREDKPAGERNGEVPRNRNFREGDRTPKGPDSENGPRGPRNDDGRRGPRRDGDRPFRGDRDRNGGDGEGKPPRRETRERRDFQERPEFPREGGENGEVRQERRTNGPPMGRTKGVGRGGGPGRNFDSRGKREFDRKSGSDKTGVKAVEKREGGGAHNWGNHKDDLEAVNLNSTNASEENADWSEGKPAYNDIGANDGKDGEKNPTDGEGGPPAEDEPKELTLDEYRALRGKRELPQYNLRKAGEGEDLTQWKNMYEIKKKKDSENHEEEEEFDAGECQQKGGRQRLLLDIDITFSDSRRGNRGGRGGRPSRPGGLNSTPSNTRTRQRDGNRRGGQRDDYGGGREYRGNSQAAPKVDDEHDFPSLG
ncbi:hypothetical protein RUM44_006479 [Polyplax serrata]|uniref:Hyaluronan/mRNA-binding protein domain-containing protein n=1 Tax=Polyplax serrata TaxID=468196 RepID=A0ABR1AI84_POLSC